MEAKHIEESDHTVFRYKRLLTAVITGLCLLTLVTCGKDSPTKPDPPPAPPFIPVPTRVAITPEAPTLSAIGQTVQMSAVVFDQNGDRMTAAVSWSSSDTAVVRVSPAGLAIAEANGTAAITARAGTVSSTVNVTVQQSVVRISIVPETATLHAIGQTVQLSATVLDQNGHTITGASVNWESENLPVATVSDRGLVTARMDGQATILARFDGVTAQASVIVMQAATRIVIMPETPVMDAIGQTVQLSATVLDENDGPVQDASVQWTSSDPAVAVVDSTGLVTAVNNGRAMITAMSGEAAASVVATVSLTVARIEVEPASVSLMSAGETVQLSAIVYDRNDTVIPGAAVTWSSSDPSVASVSTSGLVTAKMNGEVQVTASFGDQSGSARIEVVIPSPDRGSLAALYDALEGANWINGDNWLTEAPVDEWNGVTADGQGRVTELDLSINGLRGALPTRVADLTGLKRLVLSGNPGLSGILPREMIGLSLDVFHLDGTDQCAPTDADFQAWLDRIPDSMVESCDAARQDREALVAFYNATDGPNWNDRTNWLSDASLNAWHGVTADPQGRVTQVFMLRNNLDGEIPPEIGRLTALESLSLLENNLHGPIPTELLQLEKLRTLSLHSNDLSGPLSPEIGQMESLVNLDLGSNELSGSIPPELGRLEGLGNLSLRGNRLSGPIPPELGRLTGLGSLFLDSNRLSGTIPTELGALKELRLLWLSFNRLAGPIPVELGRLEKLENLSLVRNQLSGSIPSGLGRLQSLENLSLERNRLSGSIPAELGKIDYFESMNLSFNRELSGPLPRTFLDTRIRSLNLEGTGVCVPPDDEFVEWFGSIRTVHAAYCGNTVRDALVALYNATEGREWDNRRNWLSDRPPGEWHGVTADDDGRVIALRLQNNNLNGSLPALLFALPDLKILDLSGNPGLSGPLPRSLLELDVDELNLDDTMLCVPADGEFRAWLAEIPEARAVACAGQSPDLQALIALYNATGGPGWSKNANWLSDAPFGEWEGVTTNAGGRVVEVHLNDENLSGSLPAEIGLLDRLEGLFLYNNELTGSIPSELGRLHRLKHLYLGNNELTGRIPPEIGQLNELEVLSLSGNGLTGTIPAEIGGLPRLKWMWLGGNELTGAIPAALGQLKNLELLFLSGNMLTGPLPPEMGNLGNLETLVMFSNRLDGPIPPEWGNLVNLQSLALWNNRLSGEIPAELGQLENLSGLTLHTNRLTGRIPPAIGNLGRLRTLRLQENQLTGPIPGELGGLSGLRELFLNENRLSGALPSELGNLSQLRSLKLGGNAGLSGPLPLSFTGLNLETLSAEGTDLCASSDPEIAEWLNNLPFSSVPNCDPGDDPVLYLTQAVQSRVRPVPLVAGEDALLRLFVTADGGNEAGRPPIQATFYHDGAEVHSLEVPGMSLPIPAEIDEGSLASSINVPVLGWLIQPDLELVVDIDPAPSTETRDGKSIRVPSEGRMPVEVWKVPPFDLTLVPLLWNDDPDHAILSEVESLTPEDDVFWQTRDLLPVGEFQLSIREPILTSVDPIHENRGRLLSEVRAIHLMDGGQGHYMGVLRGYGGVAVIGNPTILSGLNASTIAHELGHALSLGHTNCGDTAVIGIDPGYPYENGDIGVWGYDMRDGTLVPPDTKDMMGYCRPVWISDYHFVKAMRFRGFVQQSLASMAGSAPTTSLLLWGNVDESGQMNLEPAFPVYAPAALPETGGPYRVTGADRGGRAVFSVNFHMHHIGHGDGAYFAFILPMRNDWPDRLQRITLTGPEGAVSLDSRSERSAALLVDPLTGLARGILRDWQHSEAGASTAARVLNDPDLEVVVSRGVPRTVRSAQPARPVPR
ncbi:MAG: Ig-like domain-containing protein [Gemmatimonadota bacterium]|nr:Ig-like domain-containing protein [Gemmatimonadota bacterium]